MAALNFKRELRRTENLLCISNPKRKALINPGLLSFTFKSDPRTKKLPGASVPHSGVWGRVLDQRGAPRWPPLPGQGVGGRSRRAVCNFESPGVTAGGQGHFILHPVSSDRCLHAHSRSIRPGRPGTRHPPTPPSADPVQAGVNAVAPGHSQRANRPSRRIAVHAREKGPYL